MVLTECQYFDHLTVFRNKKYITSHLPIPILSIAHHLIFFETVIFLRATANREHFRLTRRTGWRQVPLDIYSCSLRLTSSTWSIKDKHKLFYISILVNYYWNNDLFLKSNLIFKLEIIQPNKNKSMTILVKQLILV